MWIGREDQVADCLTKIGGKEGILLRYNMGTKREGESEARLIDY